MMNLLIISDTPMFGNGMDTTIEVYEPTLREIEAISYRFSMVTWYGYLSSDRNPGYARIPLHKNMVAKPILKLVGGPGLFDKLKLLPALPLLFAHVWKEVKKYDVIHSRGPSVPAFVAILISFMMRKKVYWHKYAGNWGELSPPFMYQIQRSLLRRSRQSIVTINGNWPDQPIHIRSFLNPCFTEEERRSASHESVQKKFDGLLSICFVGAITEFKGVLRLIKVLAELDERLGRISNLVIAGDGPAIGEAKDLAKALKIRIDFLGFLRRDELNRVYNQCHLMVLPSRTEGFPKVIGEASSFGCIPVVTNVSSISQFIRDGHNGFLLENNDEETIGQKLVEILSKPLKTISINCMEASTSLTYERFDNQLMKALHLS